jgi:hypothetical protein
MQTFLPYPHFRQSAEVLDSKRLGKQRVEAEQIARALTSPEYGWQNHPAVKMWRGYLPALLAYRDAMIFEWCSRGYRNTMPYRAESPLYEVPPWLGDESFHLSHQSNLIRKLPSYYAPKFPGVSGDLPYLWPTQSSPADLHSPIAPKISGSGQTS